jgi:hypothetical protein
MIFTIKGREVLVDNAYSYLLGGTFGGFNTWCLDYKGYLVGHVDGKVQKLHRLIANNAGLDISNQIDHINGNRLDNRLINLRYATNSQNQCNRVKSNRNKSGFKGVSWSSSHKKWCAQIMINRKLTNLGYYLTPEQAHEVYKVAAIQLHGVFANFG